MRTVLSSTHADCAVSARQSGDAGAPTAWAAEGAWQALASARGPGSAGAATEEMAALPATASVSIQARWRLMSWGTMSRWGMDAEMVVLLHKSRLTSH